jgi:hypothetical protein
MDACCFVELVKGRFGKAVLNDGLYIPNIEALLRASRDRQVEVCTSMTSVAECLSADGLIDQSVRDLFSKMLTSGRGGVTLLECDIFVVERARDLRWVHEINLGSIDAIHVATALEHSCEEFLTTDGVNGGAKKILTKASDLSKLGLRVLTPDKTGLVPDAYKQHELKLAPSDKGDDNEEVRAAV